MAAAYVDGDINGGHGPPYVDSAAHSTRKKAMRRTAAWLVAFALGMGVTGPVQAALEVGAPAPDFTVPASLAGKDYQYALAEALKKGPAVVYFYPKAFTAGCTVEAHLFAKAMPEFSALGATVIGISGDDLATLHRFSLSECGGKFPVGADPDGAVIKAYDVKLPVLGYASRTSYVIGQDGKIAHVYSAMSPDQHVQQTLAAVKALQATRVPAK